MRVQRKAIQLFLKEYKKPSTRIQIWLTNAISNRHDLYIQSFTQNYKLINFKKKKIYLFITSI